MNKLEELLLDIFLNSMNKDGQSLDNNLDKIKNFV